MNLENAEETVYIHYLEIKAAFMFDFTEQYDASSDTFPRSQTTVS